MHLDDTQIRHALYKGDEEERIEESRQKRSLSVIEQNMVYKKRKQ